MTPFEAFRAEEAKMLEAKKKQKEEQSEYDPLDTSK